jgi:hypothetical protein
LGGFFVGKSKKSIPENTPKAPKALLHRDLKVQFFHAEAGGHLGLLGLVG